MAKSPLFRNHRFLQDTGLGGLRSVLFFSDIDAFLKFVVIYHLLDLEKKSRIFKHFQSFLTLKIFWLKIFWLYNFIDFEKLFDFENFFTLKIIRLWKLFDFWKYLDFEIFLDFENFWTLKIFRLSNFFDWEHFSTLDFFFTINIFWLWNFSWFWIFSILKTLPTEFSEIFQTVIFSTLNFFFSTLNIFRL